MKVDGQVEKYLIWQIFSCFKASNDLANLIILFARIICLNFFTANHFLPCQKRNTIAADPSPIIVPS